MSLELEVSTMGPHTIGSRNLPSTIKPPELVTQLTWSDTYSKEQGREESIVDAFYYTGEWPLDVLWSHTFPQQQSTERQGNDELFHLCLPNGFKVCRDWSNELAPHPAHALRHFHPCLIWKVYILQGQYVLLPCFRTTKRMSLDSASKVQGMQHTSCLLHAVDASVIWWEWRLSDTWEGLLLTVLMEPQYIKTINVKIWKKMTLMLPLVWIMASLHFFSWPKSICHLETLWMSEDVGWHLPFPRASP